jgi:hypothetical protein
VSVLTVLVAIRFLSSISLVQYLEHTWVLCVINVCLQLGVDPNIHGPWRCVSDRLLITFARCQSSSLANSSLVNYITKECYYTSLNWELIRTGIVAGFSWLFLVWRYFNFEHWWIVETIIQRLPCTLGQGIYTLLNGSSFMVFPTWCHIRCEVDNYSP